MVVIPCLVSQKTVRVQKFRLRIDNVIVVRFLRYLGYLSINLDITDIKGKLNISATEGYGVYYWW